jgi:TRAP-type mannitol/chloroaromatic compound transport system permease small subunit
MTATFTMIGTFLRRLSAAAGWFALAFMASVGAVDVLGTALFNKPLGGAFEMSEQALAAVVFLGLLHTQIQQSHIVVDIVSERLRGRSAMLSRGFALSATALALGLIAVQTWPLFTASLHIREQAPGALGFPIWPVKGLISVGALSATVVATGQGIVAWVALIQSFRTGGVKK